MYKGSNNNLYDGWWRWPLIPVASMVGAFIGAGGFMLIQWVSMKISGRYSESGWYFQYILPFLRDGIFGFLVVFCGCLVAPRGKLIVAVILTTLMGVLFIFMAISTFKGFYGASSLGALSGLALLVGGIIATLKNE